MENINVERNTEENTEKVHEENTCHENVAHTEVDTFRVSTFYIGIDTIVNTMKNRFLHHRNLYLDLAWFDPKGLVIKRPYLTKPKTK